MSFFWGSLLFLLVCRFDVTLSQRTYYYLLLHVHAGCGLPWAARDRTARRASDDGALVPAGHW